MQSTNNSVPTLQEFLNQTDLIAILDLLNLAMKGNTNQQHVKVYQMLKVIQQKPQTYLYFTFISCNKNYSQDVRYMATITMNSALKRNSKQMHFQDNQKNIIKTTLLQNYSNNSVRLTSVQNILISQFVTCFQQVDWQLIKFLIIKISSFPQILNLLIIIFQDLKHNSQNYCYFQGNQQVLAIKELIQNVDTIMNQHAFEINLGKNLSNQYNIQVEILTRCLKLIKTLTFHMPFKLINYFQIFCKQILESLMEKFTIFIKEIKKQNDIKNFFIKWQNLSPQIKLIEQIFQTINEIVSTKPDFIIKNQNLKNFIFTLDAQSFVDVKQMNSILKTWVNIILELLFIQQASQQIFNYWQTMLPNILAGMQYTQEDQMHIKQQMELQHNPYNNEDNQEDQQNFESTYGKNHGSTLRKLSITCIEKLSQIQSENLWSISKQLIQTLLISQDYKIYQSAILYLGVIAQCCSQQMEQSINSIIKYLFEKLNSDKHEIVIATCFWTLEKLSLMFSEDLNAKFLCYKRIFQVVSVSQNKKNNTKILMVKESAISLLDQLISNEIQIEYTLYESIIKTLLIGLKQFTGRALFNVFKALSSIFQKPQTKDFSQLLVLIIQEICQKWSISIRSDSVMCPLIQCLVILCQNKKQFFINYAYDFLTQTSVFLNQIQRKALLLRSIDLTSSIIELIKGSNHQNCFKIISFVTSEAFLANLHTLIISQQKQIKHFSYGLLSDIIKIKPLSDNYAQEFIKTIAKTIDINSDTSANNALMCITDLITIHRQCGFKYAQQVMKMVVSFIYKAKNNQLPKIYLLNFSRMFGRISVIAPQSAKFYLLNNQRNLSNISNGLRGQQESELTITSYSSLLKILDNLNDQQLKSLIQTKQIQNFVQSYLEYSYNFKQSNQTNLFSQFLLKLKQLISQNNNSIWHQYLMNSTNFLPAIVNKILSMTSN